MVDYSLCGIFLTPVFYVVLQALSDALSGGHSQHAGPGVVGHPHVTSADEQPSGEGAKGAVVEPSHT